MDIDTVGKMASCQVDLLVHIGVAKMAVWMDDWSDNEKVEMLENKKDDEMAVVKATMLSVTTVGHWVPAWVE
jgi:hypothetical protein